MKRIAAIALLFCLSNAPGMTSQRIDQTDPRIAEHTPLARAMARKFVNKMGGMLELDDLVSLAMTAMWQAAPAFDESRGVTFGQYMRACIWSELRRQQKHIWRAGRRVWLQQVSIHSQGDDDLGIELPSEAPSPAILLSEARMCRMVRMAVASLPRRQRAAIEHCFFEDMTFVEAGELTGISRQAVHQQQRLALASLANQLRSVRDEGSEDDNG